MKNNFDNLLLLSGGIDSFVIANMLAVAGNRTLALILKLNKLESHVRAAINIANQLGFEHLVYDFSSVHAQLKSKDTDYIAGHRHFIYSMALAAADLNNIHSIYTGEFSMTFTSSYDYENDPDQLAFHKSLGVKIDEFGEARKCARYQLAEKYGREYRNDETAFAFVDPFWGINKPGAMKIGAKLGADFSMTVSCRNSDEYSTKDELIHCGKGSCWSCNQRKTAFIMAGLEDPTKYHTNTKVPDYYLDNAQFGR